MSARRGAACVSLLCVLAGRDAAAQSLADRIASARAPAVSFHYAARAGVCGDGEHYVRLGRSMIGSLNARSAPTACTPGPVQVRVALRDGAVDRVEYWVGPLRPHDARDLGAVSSTEAARYLVALASGGYGKPAARAILPAVLADSAVVWPSLLRIVRDTAHSSREPRREAAFWLSQYAGAAVTGRRGEPAPDDDGEGDEHDVKAHAVFVLSQLPRAESVPALLDIARTHREGRVRAKALFWLGQLEDRRAFDLFESILRG